MVPSTMRRHINAVNGGSSLSTACSSNHCSSDPVQVQSSMLRDRVGCCVVVVWWWCGCGVLCGAWCDCAGAGVLCCVVLCCGVLCVLCAVCCVVLCVLWCLRCVAVRHTHHTPHHTTPHTPLTLTRTRRQPYSGELSRPQNMDGHF